jgi:hypothetical protein
MSPSLLADSVDPGSKAAETALQKVSTQSVFVRLPREQKHPENAPNLLWIRGAEYQLLIDSLEMRHMHLEPDVCIWSRMTVTPKRTTQTRLDIEASRKKISCQDLVTLGHSLDLIRHGKIYAAIENNPILSVFAVAPPGKKTNARVSIPAGLTSTTTSGAAILNVYVHADYGYRYAYAWYSSPPNERFTIKYDASLELIKNLMENSSMLWEELPKSDAEQLFNFALRSSNIETLQDERLDYEREEVRFVENRGWVSVRTSMLDLAGRFANKQSIPSLQDMRSFMLRNMTKKNHFVRKQDLLKLDKILQAQAK